MISDRPILYSAEPDEPIIVQPIMELPPAESVSTGIYSAASIAKLLPRWPELEALAESPRSARGLAINRSGPTPEDPRPSIKHRSSGPSPMNWANIVADLERAIADLPDGSIERHVAAARTQGLTMGGIAALLRTRRATVVDAHRSAVARMSTFLEGPTEH